MTPRPQSRDRCMFCHAELSKAGMTKHLETCPQRQQAIQAAEASDRPNETLWRLRVQDAYQKDFWLDLEMRGSATLMKLDEYLRAIWLECCGHLSDFTTGGWSGVKVGKARKADQVFEPELVLRQYYDFGNTSETDIRVAGARSGKALSKHPIALLARNLQAEATCQECGQMAGWLCMECVYEEDKPGLLCAEHVEMHPHENYGEPVELVNSPRLGMCGYTGPAEPPY